MHTNAQIISDLQDKIGIHQSVDLLSDWKGVPVMVTGYIHEVREASIVFRVDAPESISFTHNDKVLILYDILIMGIQGRVLKFDPSDGIAELGEFTYIDRGFGSRSMVRVEPDNPISGKLILDNAEFSCQVIDISLNGFGLITKSNGDLDLTLGQAITIKTNLLDQEIEVSGALVGLFPKENNLRLAMTFPQDAPNHAIVTRYIARRRVEIRREIEITYQQAVSQTG